MKTLIFIFILFFLSLPSLFPQRLLREGVEAMRHKNYEDATRLLEEATKTYPSNQKAYLYLYFAYMAQEEYTLAEGILLAGVEVPGPDTSELYYHLGNLMFRRGEWAFAINYYSRSLDLQENHSPSLLNRANALVEEGSSLEQGVEFAKAWNSFRRAILDYSAFLSLNSDTPKKHKIKQMISLLKGKEQVLLDLQKTKSYSSLSKESGRSEDDQGAAFLKTLEKQNKLLQDIKGTNKGSVTRSDSDQNSQSTSSSNDDTSKKQTNTSSSTQDDISPEMEIGNNSIREEKKGDRKASSSIRESDIPTSSPETSYYKKTRPMSDMSSESSLSSELRESRSVIPTNTNRVKNASRSEKKEAVDTDSLLNSIVHNLKEESLLSNERSSLKVQEFNEEMNIDE